MPAGAINVAMAEKAHGAHANRARPCVTRDIWTDLLSVDAPRALLRHWCLSPRDILCGAVACMAVTSARRAAATLHVVTSRLLPVAHARSTPIACRRLLGPARPPWVVSVCLCSPRAAAASPASAAARRVSSVRCAHEERTRGPSEILHRAGRACSRIRPGTLHTSNASDARNNRRPVRECHRTQLCQCQ